MRQQNKIWEYTKAIGTALILALVIRTFVIQAFKIPSGSMLQTLLIGDHILVNKFIYGTPVDIPFTNITLFRMPGFKKPERGDIVVFKYPEDRNRDFIKRVIAVEGDIIEARDKKIFVNEKPITESYVLHPDNPRGGAAIEPRDNFGPYLIPKDSLFVMGDNRDHSYDSRYWGYVNMKDLKGKAFIIYWSWDNNRKLPRFGRIGNLTH
ncbi:MAG: signal peptidase I [Thermodesulfovibrionales bacterium]|nr:signal peptidase I [Thermodesulfovibrionales bacterium]